MRGAMSCSMSRDTDAATCASSAILDWIEGFAESTEPGTRSEVSRFLAPLDGRLPSARVFDGVKDALDRASARAERAASAACSAHLSRKIDE